MPKKIFDNDLPAIPGLRYSTMWSGLDIEDNDPINVPQDGHKQKYTGRNTYLDIYQEARSEKSAYGIKGDQIQDKNIFKKTNLDLERKEELGGPINVPQQRNATGFSQPNTPTNTYMDSEVSKFKGKQQQGKFKGKQ